MCAAYIAAGLPPDRFWTLTPRLFDIEMRGAANRIERERNDGIANAWLGATLARAKRIPSLQKLISPKSRRARPQSTIEKQAMFDAMAASWGAKLQ
jgi:hypothetical protein